MALRFPPLVERAMAFTFLSQPPPVLRTIIGPAQKSPDGLVLDLQVQALAWLIATMRIPELASGSVASARKVVERSAHILDVGHVPEVAAYDRAVPGAEGPLMARVYTPPGARGGAAPGLIYFHGGGWVLGTRDTYDRVCRALARVSGVIVISVEYRLAPEHPFPAPGEDAVAAARWVLENARSFGMDPLRVAVGGDSAGGNLAAVVAQALRGDAVRPAFQLLVYPATDLTRSQPSHKFFRDGYFLSGSSVNWYLERFAPDPATHTDPRGSPLHARDCSGLPPALVLTAGFDPLRDEGRAYADKMRAAGVKTEYVCLEGAVHGVMSMAGALRVGARMLTLAGEGLRRL
jgi:acetyl esterase